MRMKAETPIALEYTKRHGRMTADYAVRDIYDALVELITNCDDSYYRIGDKKGQILIEVEHRHKENSRVVVRDKAEGMTIEEMRWKIKEVGELTAAEGDRSFMGRGAKDCAILGKVTFESIKENKYHKCEVLPSMDFVAYSPSIRATADIRKRLGIHRGNGTIVTIDSSRNVNIPRHNTLLSELPWNYALRDIMHKDLGRKVFLKNLNEDTSPDRLIHADPTSEVVVDKEFEVPGFAGVIAYLQLCKASDRLEDPLDKRFRRAGVLIKSERAIHEVTLFASEFENDPHAKYYCGRLVCPYIDKLCIEYDEQQNKGLSHPESNPSLLIDPNRQSGLRREHPFTKALFQFPIECLRELILKDKEEERRIQIQIENEETTKRLKKLAKEASRFIQDKVEEIEEVTFMEEEIVNREFMKRGVLIIPDIYTLAVGEIKTFGFRAKKVETISEEQAVTVTCDNDGILVITPEFHLSQSRTSEGVLTGNFKLQGIRKIDNACVAVSYNSFPPAEALISVVESKIEEIEIPNGLAFERELYHIKEGKKKHLLLRAEYPSVVIDETPVEVACDCEDIVILRPQTRLRPIVGAHYAQGYVTIQGRKIGARGRIIARVNGRVAQTEVKVIPKEKEEGIPIRIEIRDEDYGNFRAKWDRPNNPNLLLISARHDSLKRYLGPKPDFDGQKSPHFRLLVAEIVSENIVYKVLETLENRTPWEYTDWNIERFYALHNKYMREFTPIAHETQLSKQELRSITNS